MKDRYGRKQNYQRDETESVRVLFLSRACEAMDTLKDAEGVRHVADHCLGRWRQHGADADDRLALEERRDKKIREHW